MNMDMSTVMTISKVNVTFGIGVRNLLNTRYRDYMNTMRYFTDEMGRNISFRLMIPFNFSNQ